MTRALHSLNTPKLAIFVFAFIAGKPSDKHRCSPGAELERGSRCQRVRRDPLASPDAVKHKKRDSIFPIFPTASLRMRSYILLAAVYALHPVSDQSLRALHFKHNRNFGSQFGNPASAICWTKHTTMAANALYIKRAGIPI